MTQEFVLRNRSQHRLKIQATTNTMDFKILKDRNEAEPYSSLKLLLHPQESRCVAVTFAPLHVGAAVAALNFTPVQADLHQSKKQLIHLFGYGGHAVVEVGNLTKDSSRKFLLMLDDLDGSTGVMTKRFVVHNTGVLPAFLYAIFEPRVMYSLSTVMITPSKIVLRPQQTREIAIRYTVTKEDVKYFSHVAFKDVTEMGSIKLYTGDEALRGRIRRLVRKAMNNRLEVNPIAKQLFECFENESIPEDVMRIKESLSSMRDLMQQLTVKEIVLNLDYDPEKTLVAMDETSLYQTLGQSSSDITVIDAHEDCP